MNAAGIPPGEAGGGDERLRPRGNYSYVAGATDDPLRFVTVSQALDETVATHGTRAAAIFSAERDVMSWKELQRQSDDVAGALLALGIRRGNRVGILSPNRREWLLAQFGTARIGAVLVNLNPGYRSTELEFALNKVRCRVLIVARSAKGGNHLGLLRVLAPELDRPGDKPLLEARRLPHLRHVIVLGEGLVPARAERFSDFMRRAGPNTKRRLPALAAALDPDDAVNLQFTDGTTGAPKAVALSHFNIVNNARYAARVMQITEVDRVCIAVPLHQGMGMVLGVLACVATGATMVFPGEDFDPLCTLDAVSRHRCTAIHGAPDLFAALLDQHELPDYDTSSLRTGVIAGAPCPQDTLQRLFEDLSLDEVTVAYGLTEVGPITFQSAIDDPLELRAETVGRVHPNLEAKIVDRDGHIVPIGRKGELCVRGYSVMRGYWEEPKRTRDAFDESGWMHTGDLATIDAEGYCRIVGRVRDLVVRGHELVSPPEVEALIRRHPKVQDVQVFGVSDGAQGEELCAWIVLKEGAQASAEDVRAFCLGGGGVASVPGSIRFVDGFPVTATGKVQKFLMRAAMLRELRAKEAKPA
jgi:fatty-acyl-CoA synthase